MNRLSLTAVVAAAALLGAPAAARADYVLDTFANPDPATIYQISLLNGNPYTSPTTTVSAGVTRSIQVTVNTTPVNFNSVSGTIGGGTFTMDSDNSSAATSKLTYALSGAASNLSGASGLELAFKTFDAGTAASSTPVTIEVVTKTGTLTRTTTIAESATPFTQSFAFATFTGSGNLGQVNTIRVTINGGSGTQTAVDFAMDEVRVTAVPAPPALLLGAIGLAGLVGRARLRRAATT